MMGIDLADMRVMNGGGSAKTPEDVRDLAKVSTLTHIVPGSYTIERLPGNKGERYAYHEGTGTGVNSIGLDNLGLRPEFVGQGKGREMLAIAGDHGKILRPSVACFSIEECRVAAQLLSEVDGLQEAEWNAGCPNAGHDIFSYHPDSLWEMIETVEANLAPNIKLWVKISPLFDPVLTRRIADVLKHPRVHGVTSINTIPNVRLYNPDTHAPYLNVTLPNGGRTRSGGASGDPLVFGVNMHQLNFLAQLLPNKELDSVGGIRAGWQVVEAANLGATGFQVTTHLVEHGRRVFDEIMSEAVEEELASE